MTFESRLVVRRAAQIAAPPERVWQEVESFERLKAWFGTGHTLVQYEPRVGAMVELKVEIDGEWMHYGGKVVTFDAPRELTWENDYIPNAGWAAPTYMTIRLTPNLGGTLVEILHHGFERVGDAAFAASEFLGYEGGWTTRQLEALKKIVEG